MTTFIKFLIPFLFLLYFPMSYGQGFTADAMDWFSMFMWLAGGLALFLFGMEILIKGLITVAGDQVKNLLSKLTTNRFKGALTGAGVTAVIQSSSVTSVLTVGFVSAGLITAGQAAGVIMGANLGTTVTAQLIAFKVTNFALILVAIGFAIQFFAKINKKIAIGRLIMGLGLLFFGMNVMSEGMAPLREYQPFLELMVELQNPFWAIFIGFIFTALVQSSSATIGVIIVLASNGFLTLPAGIALAMGANIGTTVTAMLSTIGKSREAIRTGLIHLQFNVLAVIIWLPFIPELSQFAVYISTHEAIINGSSMAYLAENTPREIANANTLFNLISLLIFLPFIPAFLWVVNRIVPVLEEENSTQDFQADFLDETFISNPSLAMQAVKLELEHYQQKQALFYKRVVALIENPNISKLSKENLNIKHFRNYQQNILSYLGRVGQAELSVEEQVHYIRLMNVVNNLESMLEAFESNIFNVLHNMIQNKQNPSPTMLELVGKLSNEVGKSINNSLQSIYTDKNEPALAAITITSTIDLLIQEALKHQVKRFQPTEERLMIFRNEMKLIEGFKQLHSLAKRIAQMQLDNNSEDPKTEKNLDSEKVD